MTYKEAIDFINNKIQIDVRFCSDDDINETKTALTLAIQALEKQIQIAKNEENIHEAILRLSMCARKECEICKYKDRPKDLLPSDDCKERSTKNINLIADLLLKKE